ncbi:cysteine methyltransferase [Halobacteriales archaeon QS_8_69_26]|nr:MAG: cysteine methyltransferase [Halobacteriales archaeon QS_8_69_26]
MDDAADSGPDEAGIYALDSEYLECAVQVGMASGKVIRVTVPSEPDPEAATENSLLDRIDGYLSGLEEEDFSDVEVGLTVPTDHRAVLEAVRTVPYGTEVPVEKLARMAAGVDPDDEETVRTALDGNPVPLIVPDHRVRNGPSGAPPRVEQRLRSLEGL